MLADATSGMATQVVASEGMSDGTKVAIVLAVCVVGYFAYKQWFDKD